MTAAAQLPAALDVPAALDDDTLTPVEAARFLRVSVARSR